VSRIRLLSEQVANQIAAGEVVDRPAAVVKELVENSLDAGATRVDIEVEGGGVGLVRVSDDGEGMDKDDVLLCLERHATSKLREAVELQDIRSLGFRGEALPSIASVSWLTILSRQRGQPLGTRAEVRHGVLSSVREQGCSMGTVMEVRQLFANMPARKKFLKSQRTELFHMEEAVKNLALVHPHCAFALRVEGRSVLHCPSGESQADRMRRIFRYQDVLIPLHAPQDEDAGPGEFSRDGGIRITGYLLLPEKAPARTARLRLFVNQRAVQDAMLRHTVREALQGHLMRGYLPAGMLHVHVLPAEVDVNVHPAKREIRFKSTEVVRRLVAAAVTAALERQEQSLRENLFAPASAGAKQAYPHSIGRTTYTSQEQPTRSALASAEPQPLGGLGGMTDFAQQGTGRSVQGQVQAVAWDDAVTGQSVEQAAGADLEQQGFSGLRPIGQLFSLYLLCERQGQLVVIDQHAAHERILYGRMVQHYLSGQAPGQRLLFPVTIELEPALHETLEARQEEVATMGFVLNFFGDHTWVIKQVPALSSGLAAEVVLQEVLTTLDSAPLAAQDGRLSPAMEAVFASLACKAAIKAGNRLATQEMLDLLAQMEASDIFSRCPHGRPVLKIFSAAEVEKWFHRHGS
jgi:DNA mismatch repair protein MutL